MWQLNHNTVILNRGLDLVQNITCLRMVKCTVVGEGSSQGETQTQKKQSVISYDVRVHTE